MGAITMTVVSDPPSATVVLGGEIDIATAPAIRRFLMAAITERVEARDRGAEVDHHEKECAERIDAKSGADARQADRQHRHPWRPGNEKACQRCTERNERHRQ